MKKLIVGITAAMLVATSTMPALAEIETFDTFEYKSDLKVLRDLLVENHGHLYEHITEKELNKAFDDASEAIEKDMQYNEFCELVGNIVSKIGDGHTSVSIPDWYRGEINESGTYIPLSIKKIDGKYVSDFVYNEIPLGSEIVSVNDVAIAEVIEKLQAVAGNETDAEDGLSDYVIEMLFPQIYAAFYPGQVEHKIDFIGLDKQEQTVQLTSEVASLDELMTYKYSNYLKGQYASPREALKAEFLEDKNTAILRIYTFASNDSDYFVSYVDRFFKEVAQRGCENIIFDVRGNLGGDSELMNHVLSYVFQESKYSVKKIEMQVLPELNELNMTGGQESIEYLHEMVDAAMDDTKTFEEKREEGAYREADGTFVFLEDPVEPAEENLFTGQIYALSDNGSFSCGTIFPQMIQGLENGTLVGIAPSGNYYDTTAGMMPTWTLPNTKTGVSIPLTQLTMEEKAIEGIGDRDGVKPDVELKLSLEDFLNKEDTQLNYVLDLIK